MHLRYLGNTFIQTGSLSDPFEFLSIGIRVRFETGLQYRDLRGREAGANAFRPLLDLTVGNISSDGQIAQGRAIVGSTLPV